MYIIINANKEIGIAYFKNKQKFINGKWWIKEFTPAIQQLLFALFSRHFVFGFSETQKNMTETDPERKWTKAKIVRSEIVRPYELKWKREIYLEMIGASESPVKQTLLLLVGLRRVPSGFQFRVPQWKTSGILTQRGRK